MRKKNILILIVCAFILNINQVMAATSLQDLQEAIISEKKTTFKTDKEFYKYAQKNLDKNTYNVYRVAERLIRANRLDDYPWVIEFRYSDDYEINATASNNNLITLKPGVLYTFSNDISALAFIIAHEMAHKTCLHTAQKEKYINFLKVQYDDQMKRLEEKKAQLNRSSSRAPMFRRSLIERNLSLLIENLQQELEKLKMQQEEDLKAFDRKQEYEADKVALNYIIKAGFDPEGAKRVLVLMQRDSGTVQNTLNHPDLKNRIWQLNTELKNLNSIDLVNKGKKNIAKTPVLTYELKTDRKYNELVKRTLVINSSKGTNQKVNEPFEKMFGY